ncbi:phosphoserine phosphatase-like [Corticium candelabrum]|uniref:phosphoserine phosphatase-like n=1 Tax=Corticium candelabrum TaxID=121492 RepID=UPI002E273D30|nr:phosphoserine phosphatase-like [Corticium candelabrum]
MNTAELETLTVWQRADAVCFDVDSTVIKEEGIDELASFCGVGEQVKEWTKKAMGGSIPFRTALSERLKMCKPTSKQVQRLVAERPSQLTPGIQELVQQLHRKGTSVYLVSGGFRQIISPVAAKLRIPPENLFVNNLLFNEAGEYVGFDENEPTSETGGKKKVMETLKKKFGYKYLVMVGDGATDMEACPPADAFIGFGGNRVRQTVREKAKLFVTDFSTLRHALGPEE